MISVNKLVSINNIKQKMIKKKALILSFYKSFIKSLIISFKGLTALICSIEGPATK
jgi:hypothetical protein